MLNGSGPCTNCPTCGASDAVAMLTVAEGVAGDGSQACVACGASFVCTSGVLQLRPAPPEWGYTKWNSIRKVADAAWTTTWEKACVGQPWLSWAGRAMPLLACGIPDGGHVLDVGSGPGAMLAGLASAGYQVTGLDASEPLLRFSAARLHQQGMGERSRLVCSDFTSFKAPKETYDAIVMNGFLEWLPEFVAEDRREPVAIQAEAVARAAEWLKPGGCMIIGLENRFGLKYWLGGYDDHTNLRFTSVVPRWLGGWLYRKKHKKEFRCHTPSLFDLHRWARGGGLSVETVLAPLPTYREPHACIRADDVNGALEVARINRSWLRTVPLRHRVMASGAMILSPLLRLFPGLGRLFANYFMVVLRKPGEGAAASNGLKWRGVGEARLVRNQHVGTWSNVDTLRRVSLTTDCAAKEGELQQLAFDRIDVAYRNSINPPTRVHRNGNVFGSADYSKVKAEQAKPEDVHALLPQIEQFLRALAEVRVPIETTLCTPLRVLYMLGEEGASYLVDELVDGVAGMLPMDRLTHGDIRPGNLLIIKESFIAVDWEAAGAGHPWLDWVRLRLGLEGKVSAASLPSLVERIRRLGANDAWSREVLAPDKDGRVLLLAAGYALVAKDLEGLRAARKAGKPVISELRKLCGVAV